MTLKEMKIKTFSLIEEYYPDKTGFAEDEDVLNKINGVVNAIQLDLMPYKKIPAKMELNITKNENTLLLSDIDELYQISKITGAKYEIVSDYEIVFDLEDKEEASITIYYYKYPTLVKTIFSGSNEEEIQANKNKEDEKYTFELDLELLEIMPYGIASDLLKMDMISGYGKYFYERYIEMKNSIISRKTSGIINIVGGIDI